MYKQQEFEIQPLETLPEEYRWLIYNTQNKNVDLTRKKQGQKQQQPLLSSHEPSFLFNFNYII